MTQRNNSAENRLHHLWQKCLTTRRFASTLPAQSLAWLGSMSMLSNGGLVFAQSESQVDNIVPTVESSQPAPATVKVTIEQNNSTSAPEATRSQPQFSQRRARLKQRLSKSKASSPVVVIKKSRPLAEDSRPEVAIRKSRPQVEVAVPSESVRKLRARSQATRNASEIIRAKPQEAVPPSATVRREAQQESQGYASPSVPSSGKDYNNAYIDPTNYDADGTKKYEAPNSVVITERAGYCKTIVGQGIPSSVCAKVPYQKLANSGAGVSQGKAPSWIRKSKPTTTLATAGLRRGKSEQNSLVRSTPRVTSGVVSRTLMRSTSRMASANVTKNTYTPNRFIPNFNPTTTVSSVPIAPSAGALPAPMTAENVAPRASNITYDIPLAAVLPQINYGGVYGGRVASGTGLMYPLSIPSAMTSVFGWRVHPITGDRRFHSGTDIGAAMGTPVLAAYSGKVEIADWMGGYGMTVILNHSNAQQTLYGHMSEIFVQPGQVVEQGTVIGRVGSTGNSTGPHLHFEVRHLTPEGWVATDPGAQLEYALGQLVQSLQTAQATRQPGS
jgi:murein DD-endopeptidase MepM/ murein hydrolase activator NlpD